MTASTDDPKIRLAMMREEFKRKFGIDWQQQEQFYATVGRAISFWSSMESRLLLIATLLLDTHPAKVGLIFYSIINTHVWLNVIDELFLLERRHADYRPKFTAISADIRRLNDTRVRLAHHGDRYDPSNPIPALKVPELDTRLKSRNYAPLSDLEIHEFSKEVIDISERLIALATAMRETSPETLQQASGDQHPKDAQ